MKYINIPLKSDKWLLKHAEDIERFFKFCHCTGEDCAGDCPYASIGANDFQSYPPEWDRKECTVLLLKHYKRLMYLKGKSRKEINNEERKVKLAIKECTKYYGVNYSGIRP